MSQLFGGGANTPQQEVYAGIQITTSILGQPIPFVAGRQKVPPILIWYGNFQVNGQSQGNKGGGNSGTTTYQYSASWVSALGLGPVVGINRIWNGKKLWDQGETQNLIDENLALSLGGAAFTGSIASGVLTASNVIGYIQTGAVLSGVSIAAGITITGQTGGTTGGAGTYTLSSAITVGSEAMTSSQIAWGGYPSGTPAGQQLPYENVCTVASSGYNFGASAAMPQLNFELEGCVPGFSDAHGMYDADPTAVIPVYLQHPIIGAGFQGSIQSLQGVTNTVQAYCMCLGLQVSTYENNQRAATDYMKELLQIMNCDGFVSVGQLKLLPLGDQPLAATTPDGTNWSWTPNLTPLFIFNDDDYCPKPGETPVKLTQKALNQTHNMVNVQYRDRSNYYNDAPVNASLINDIGLTGPRLMNQLSFPQITNAQTALMVGQLILQADRYEVNTYEIRVPQDFSQAEPNDYVALNDSSMGLVKQVCRILEVEDDQDDMLVIRALEIPGVVRSTPQYNWGASAGYFANYATAPGSAQAPVIFPMPGSFSKGTPTLGIAVCGQTQNAFWKGCMVYCSFDGGNTYGPVGQVGPNGPARYGVISGNITAGTADPDVTHTLGVELANTTEQLSTAATHAQADAAQTLVLVDSGTNAELLSYGAAALTAPGAYNLSYLRRGLYGSVNGVHLGCSFTGSISGTTLTVSSPTGTLANGQTVLGAGVLPGTKLVSGAGSSWVVNNSQTVASEAMIAGVPFVRIDGAIFQLPIDEGYTGQTLFFKFCSFNTWGQANEILANVPAYSYVVPPGPLIGAAQLVPRGNAALTPAGLLYKSAAGTTAWDSDCVSNTTFSSCSVSAQLGASSVNAGVAIGLVSSVPTLPTTLQPNVNMDFSMAAGVGNPWTIYEGINNRGTFATAAVGDFALVTFDGFFVRYWLNGTLLRTAASEAALYIGLALEPAGAVLSNVQTGPFTIVTPTQWATVGTALVNDENVSKPTGSSAWDSAAVSITGYTTCHIAGKTNDVNTSAPLGRCMMGLCTPTHLAEILEQGTGLTALYYGLDYAWYSNENNWSIYEAGTLISTPSTAAARTDKVWINYDGAHVFYYLNDPINPVRTVAASGLTLYGAVLPFDVSVSCGMNSVEFGPGTNLKVNDTAELGSNAATDTVVATGSATLVHTGWTTAASVSVGPYPWPATVVVTATCELTQEFTGGGGGTVFLFSATALLDSVSGLRQCNVNTQGNVPGVATDEIVNSVTAEYTWALAANTTATYSWQGEQGTPTQLTATMGSAIIKAEVIKR